MRHKQEWDGEETHLGPEREDSSLEEAQLELSLEEQIGAGVFIIAF